MYQIPGAILKDIWLLRTNTQDDEIPDKTQICRSLGCFRQDQRENVKAMNEKKKVLIVNNPMKYGGLDLAAVRLQQNLDKEKYECSYCLRYSSEIGPMESKVADTGVRIIHQPDNRCSRKESYKFYCELFEKEHFDIVHCHPSVMVLDLVTS